MINLNDITKRKQLVEKYLNAETTVEEERMLRDFYSHTEEPLTPEDEDMRLLMKATDRLKDKFILSDEKAKEFDCLTVDKPKRHGKNIPLYWLIPAAAASVISFLLLTNSQEHQVIERLRVGDLCSGIQNPVAMAVPEDIIPKKEETGMLSQRDKEDVDNASHAEVTRKPQIISHRHKRKEADAGIHVAEMTEAANYQNEQVEFYRLRPAGDATIITKTCSDGSTAACIVSLSDDNESYHVIPINI